MTATICCPSSPFFFSRFLSLSSLRRRERVFDTFAARHSADCSPHCGHGGPVGGGPALHHRRCRRRGPGCGCEVSYLPLASAAAPVSGVQTDARTRSSSPYAPRCRTPCALSIFSAILSALWCSPDLLRTSPLCTLAIYAPFLAADFSALYAFPSVLTRSLVWMHQSRPVRAPCRRPHQRAALGQEPQPHNPESSSTPSSSPCLADFYLLLYTVLLTVHPSLLLPYLFLYTISPSSPSCLYLLFFFPLSSFFFSFPFVFFYISSSILLPSALLSASAPPAPRRLRRHRARDPAVRRPRANSRPSPATTTQKRPLPIRLYRLLPYPFPPTTPTRTEEKHNPPSSVSPPLTHPPPPPPSIGTPRAPDLPTGRFASLFYNL